jgi:hypothetical protein
VSERFALGFRKKNVPSRNGLDPRGAQSAGNGLAGLAKADEAETGGVSRLRHLEVLCGSNVNLAGLSEALSTLQVVLHCSRAFA